MKPIRVLAVGALALIAGSSAVWAQTVPEGRVYTFHSTAQAGCPALDWHVVVRPNSTLVGVIAWDDMAAMARATGSPDLQARTFQMTAQEIGGQNRTATIDGTVRQDGWLIANIKAPHLACTGIKVPWSSPTPGN